MSTNTHTINDSNNNNEKLCNNEIRNNMKPIKEGGMWGLGVDSEKANIYIMEK